MVHGRNLELTDFCELELELRKLSVILLDKLVLRELFFGFDNIRKLGFKNS